MILLEKKNHLIKNEDCKTKKKRTTTKPGNKHQNSSNKTLISNNYPKCKCIELLGFPFKDIEQTNG